MIAAYTVFQSDEGLLDRARRMANSLKVGAGTGKASGWLSGLSAFAFCEGTTPGSTCATPRGDIVLFNGYIVNRAELRAALGGGALDDAAIYAAGHAAWGDAIDLRIVGEFSAIIVLADAPEIRIARSPINAPPLHIWRDRHCLAVATTPRAIFAGGDMAREIDEQKIADSLFLNYYEGERSWFKGVSRLPLGARARISREGIRTERYYDLGSLPDVRLKRDQDYVEAADALMREGTRAALDGFSQPAVSVSGGFDSQAVSAYAMREREGPLIGYTSVPEAGWDGIVSGTRFGDERAHVLALAQMYPQFEANFIDAAGLSFDHLQRELFMTGSVAPRNGMNLHWIHAIRDAAVRRGCDVMLTGAIGNATFSFAGDGALPNWFATGRWLRLLSELRHQQSEVSLPRRFAALVVKPWLPHPMSRAITRWRHGDAGDPLDEWCPLNGDYARDMRVHERAVEMGYDPYYRKHRSTRAWRSAVMGNAANEVGDIHLGFELLHGIPTRDPTAYRPLVEFCAGIPDDQYLRRGQTRWLARRMLKGKLPDIVLNENRRGLQAADWHLRISRQRDALIAELGQLAEDPEMARRLNLARLRQDLVDFPDGTPTDKVSRSRLQLALTRGLTTARYIRHAEGRND